MFWETTASGFRVTEFKDKATPAELGLHGDLYLVSLLGSPRGKVLRLSLLGSGLQEGHDGRESRAKGVIEDSCSVG